MQWHFLGEGKAFESGINSLITDNYSKISEQSKQFKKSEQLEQSSDYHRYISTESNNNLSISNNASQINGLSDSDNLLLTLKKSGGEIKISTDKQMSQRLPVAFALVKSR